jgi:hypothetical protein
VDVVADFLQGTIQYECSDRVALPTALTVAKSLISPIENRTAKVAENRHSISIRRAYLLIGNDNDTYKYENISATTFLKEQYLQIGRCHGNRLMLFQGQGCRDAQREHRL